LVTLTALDTNASPEGWIPAGENRLVVTPGVFSGHFAPSGSKCCFGAVSPLSNGHGDSTVGGHFGPELKFAGLDLIVFSGILYAVKRKVWAGLH
jgi:aldehyde:ferredoxin oxidoreductase